MNPHPIFSIAFITLALLGNSACHNTNDAEKQLAIDSLNFIKAHYVFKLPPPNDTLVIKEKHTAVFIEIDSLQIEKWKKAIGEENFYIGADDYLYYMHLANEYLEKQKLKLVFVKSATQVIQFIGKEQSETLVKLDTLSELWNVYFFTPNKMPIQVGLTDVEATYADYFGKR